MATTGKTRLWLIFGSIFKITVCFGCSGESTPCFQRTNKPLRGDHHERPSKKAEVEGAPTEEETLFDLEVYGDNESATKALINGEKEANTSPPFMSILEALR